MGKVLEGDCLEVMRGMEENSIDAVVCDPPYGLEFMGMKWDRLGNVGEGKSKTPTPSKSGQPFSERIGRVTYNASQNVRCKKCKHWKFSGTPCKCVSPDFPNIRSAQAQAMQDWHFAWACEALRVAKPGAYLLAFGGTRTFHRLACAIEDAGWVLKDTLMYCYGSGFPKSRQVSHDPRFCQCAASEHNASSTAPAPSPDVHKDTEDGVSDNAHSEFDAPHLKRKAQDSLGDYPPDSRSCDARSREDKSFDQASFPSQEYAQEHSRPCEPDDAPASESSHSPCQAQRNDLPANKDSSLEANSESAIQESNSASNTRADTSKSSRRKQGNSHDFSYPDYGIGFPRCQVCGKPKADGFGTALKPAYESIILAQAPLNGTYAENVLKWGCGALNIDRCRIGLNNEKQPTGSGDRTSWRAKEERSDIPASDGNTTHKQGRWPANFLLSHSSIPVMRLKGKLPHDIMAVIREYFDGYINLQAVRERKRNDAISSSSGATLLQRKMQERQRKDEGNAGQGLAELPFLQEAVPVLPGVGAERETEVLRKEMPGQAPTDVAGREVSTLAQEAHTEIEGQNIAHPDGQLPTAGKTSTMEGREMPDGEGVCNGHDRHSSRETKGAGEADVSEAALHTGASSCDGGQAQSSAKNGGDSASFERHQGRQSPEEPRAIKQAGTHAGAPDSGAEVGGGATGNQALEVIACDIPEGWLKYFELTGEDLGCEKVGEKRVKSGIAINEKRPAEKPKNVYGDFDRMRGENAGYGLETVEDWRCVPDCPVAILDGQSGVTKSTGGSGYASQHPKRGSHTMAWMSGQCANLGGLGDVGGASRFFYCAKASRRERNAGLEDFDRGEAGRWNIRGKWTNETTPSANSHPTVKPIALMRYLCRLVTPPGGMVLDPFAGSGSTGCAAAIDGFQFVGIEREKGYAEIARARIEHWESQRERGPERR